MTRNVSFLLLSGGVGARSGHFEPKQFRKIHQIEMIAYSLRQAALHPRIDEIITNAPDGYEERTKVLCERYAPGRRVIIQPCGKTRQDSVRILAEKASHETVILHEAARPMLDRGMIDELLTSECRNAGLFAAIPFSICEVDLETGMVKGNIPRATAFNIQLPQKFDRDMLLEAHRLAALSGQEFTEDSVMLQQLLGAEVRAMAGHVRNIKVTSPEDFGIVSRLMEKEN